VELVVVDNVGEDRVGDDEGGGHAEADDGAEDEDEAALHALRRDEEADEEHGSVKEARGREHLALAVALGRPDEERDGDEDGEDHGRKRERLQGIPVLDLHAVVDVVSEQVGRQQAGEGHRDAE